MPFDASRAQKNLQAAARADATAPDPESASSAPSASAEASGQRRFQRSPSEGAAPSPAPTAEPRRFQRSGPEAPAPAPAAVSPAPARGFQRHGNAPAQPYAPPSGRSFTPRTAAPAPSAAPPAQPPAPPRNYGSDQSQVMQVETIASKGYGNRVGPARQTSRPGLTPRLELYIDELACSRGWSKDEVEKRKNEAIQKPQEAEAAYRQMFERIRVQRQQAVASITQGIQDHPGQVVFLTRRSDNEPGKFSALSPEEAGDLRILHGSVFHSMPASATLFADPATVFAPKATAALAVEDNSDLDADDLPMLDDAPAPAPGRRSIRP